ncbi:MAG TPA: M48 family metalloprotease [Puia sp.]|nr:M48 family metalloprotease [Puia sp.]
MNTPLYPSSSAARPTSPSGAHPVSASGVHPPSPANVYPPSPANVDPEKLTISPGFRSQVPRVIGAILLFIFVYLLLVTLAAGLAIGCGYLGIALILHLTNFYGIILGLGVIGVGISVFIFLVKFIFAVAKDENSNRIRITESEQPRLFAFIRQLAAETHTRFPRKIFLSPGVNAGVFYNSSFWSMFLPVRKNLDIGLGLVNGVNLSEFKAVIAHEFGHFSQRSMRLGSFTYNVNRVIYNMLYENNDYTAFLRTWGSIHSYLRLFVSITARIAGGIQWLLRKMYRLINKTYMGLSREMEFHADTVAAGVSGNNNCVSALTRIEVASSCYHTALNDANEQLKTHKVTRNIYPNQLAVMHTVAAEYDMPVREGLPEFTFHFIDSFSRSRINYKDQWASHPTLRERTANLDRLQSPVPPENTLAWQLFEDAEAWQERLTSQIYRSVTLESPTTYDTAEFSQRYRQNKANYALPSVFNGFYDGRYIDIVTWDLDELTTGPAPAFPFNATAAAELFDDSNSGLHTTLESNRKDLELLKAIEAGQTSITTFDFDGVKYRVADCSTLIPALEKEIAAQSRRLQELDKTAFLLFYHSGRIDRNDLAAAYRRFRSEHLRCEEYTTLVNNLLARLRPFYSKKLSYADVHDILGQLRRNEEAQLKKRYQQILDENLLDSPEPVRAFLTKTYVYFFDGKFMNNELNELTGLAMKTGEQLNQRRFAAYKAMLELQAAAL